MTAPSRSVTTVCYKPFSAHLDFTPWNDRAFGGITAAIIFDEFRTYAEAINLNSKPSWFVNLMRQHGIAYASASCAADDHLKKAFLSHLGFDFVYQTFTAAYRLPNNVSTLACNNMREVPKEEVDVKDVIRLCLDRMKHGRFLEDQLTHNFAHARNRDFINDLHHRSDIQSFFTVDSDGFLNGYAYIRIHNRSADLVMMGIDEQRAPINGGELFWRKALQFLSRQKLAQRVQTRVPAANLGVINIYSKIGFSFIRPAYDFRIISSDVDNQQ